VQLYDVTRTRIVKAITPDELNRMAAQGSIGWFTIKGKTRVCMQQIPMQSRMSEHIRSKVSLVGSDMEMNAEGAFAEAKGMGGIRKYGYNRFGSIDSEIVGNRVDQSMSKVETWPAVYDEKNVTICAGLVHGATEIRAEQLASL
jgi:hypothetical protein